MMYSNIGLSFRETLPLRGPKTPCHYTAGLVLPLGYKRYDMKASLWLTPWNSFEFGSEFTYLDTSEIQQDSFDQMNELMCLFLSLQETEELTIAEAWDFRIRFRFFH